MIPRRQLLVVCILVALGVANVAAEFDWDAYCQHPDRKPSLLFPVTYVQEINGSRCLTDEQNKNIDAYGKKFAQERVISDIEPVLLVPGLGGSALEVQLNNTDEPHFYCTRNSEWFRLWVALQYMLPGELDCWYHDMHINYFPNNDTYANNPGVNVRPLDWGGLSGIDYLDRIFGVEVAATAYFGPLIKNLEAVGYVPGKNLRGAPFDWRLAKNPGNMYQNLKALIEEMYAENHNKKIHVVAHSMGCIHATEFFATVPKAWKNAHIASFISVAGPFSGSPQATRALISGDNFGLSLGGWFDLVDPLQVANLVRQAGGVVWLMPELDFWNDTVIVKTKERTYSVSEFPELFNDLKSPITNTIYQTLSGLMSEIPAPGVPIHCLYGVNKQTEISYYYDRGFNRDPQITYTNFGDGVVPGISLAQCDVFAKLQNEPVDVKQFNLADHFSILFDEGLLEYILTLVTVATAPA